MAAITIDTSEVRPLTGAIVRRFQASASGSIGDAVYVHTDGTVKPGDADVAASAQVRGIVVANGIKGKETYASGDMLDVVTHGPVALGATGLTEGAVVYASVTAGALDQTAPAVASGDFPFIIGWAEQDGVVYVQPQVAVPTAA